MRWGNKAWSVSYFLSNTSAKNVVIDRVCQDYSKSKVGRFLRHGVVASLVRVIGDRARVAIVVVRLVGMEEIYYASLSLPDWWRRREMRRQRPLMVGGVGTETVELIMQISAGD